MPKRWVHALFKYIMLLGILAVAGVLSVVYSDVIFAQADGADAPLKTEPTYEYQAPIISPTSVAFFNCPGSKEPVHMEKQELLAEWLEWGEYVLEVDAVEDYLERGEYPSHYLLRKFHVSRVLRGNYVGDRDIYIDYEPEIEDEAKMLPVNTSKMVKYPIKRAYLILNRNNVANAPSAPGRKCWIYDTEAYYYQFFVYGEEVEEVIEEFLAIPEDKNREYLPTIQ